MAKWKLYSGWSEAAGSNRKEKKKNKVGNEIMYIYVEAVKGEDIGGWAVLQAVMRERQ